MDQIVSNWLMIYLCLGIIWGVLVLATIHNDLRYNTLRRLFVFGLNVAIWWIALPTWLFAKVVLKRNTLFK